MTTRYTEKEARELRMQLVANDVFCIVFAELREMWKNGTSNLSDVEIWMEAKTLTNKIMTCAAPEEIIDDFIADAREQVDSETDLFLVVMVATCQLAALREQKENADRIIRLLLPYCRKQGEMHKHLWNNWDCKEHSMKTIGRKVDLFTYVLNDIGDTEKENIVQYIGLFIDAALTMPAEYITGNLLALNLLNIKLNHILDDRILEMYQAVYDKSDVKPKWEVILGNKNVAENGATQINTTDSINPEQIKALFGQDKTNKLT